MEVKINQTMECENKWEIGVCLNGFQTSFLTPMDLNEIKKLRNRLNEFIFDQNEKERKRIETEFTSKLIKHLSDED